MDQPEKNYGIAGLATMAVLALVLHYALNLSLFERWAEYLPFLDKLSLTVFLILAIQLLGRTMERVIDHSVESPGNRYNLLRITRLLSVMLILIIAASFLFQNLYAAAVSFGLISLSRSQPSPQRSSVPGRKFSTRMSAVAIRRRAISCPSGSRRLSVIDFLLRAITGHQRERPSFRCWPQARIGSPTPGASTLITSAPKSARS